LPEAGALAGASVRDVLADATRMLAEAGCDSPRLDAELLLADALGVDRTRLMLDARSVLHRGAALGRFEALLQRRVAREPVAYILGRKEFCRLTLHVDGRVLIPRPETELLVEVGLGLPAGARVVDVGTGSGAVALALKDERPDLDVSATDNSAAALGVARENARRLGLAVRFLQADLLDEGHYDAVLANLPYVSDGSPLPPEIASYEPAEALHGGPDGLGVVRRLITHLGDVGLVALELDPDQADAVAGLLTGAGFRTVELLRDLAGHERVVIGRR
jgi:release factor glutamine methyltransferase